MHRFANPARFLKTARPATLWTLWPGLALSLIGIVAGLFFVPADYLQGDAFRILYIHAPSAWLGMAGWSGIAVASIMVLVWRHPLAAVAGRALAPVGATFTALCLATGSIWGRPTWGTWWEWDGRLTSMLILFFLFLAYIALADAEASQRRDSEGKLAAIFGLVGAINLPIIHYSVVWWNSLHQGRSISIVEGRSSIDGSMLWPLGLTFLGLTLLFTATVLMRMRALLAKARQRARIARRTAEAT